MASTNRSKLLDSFFYDSQTWGALHKAWKGYIIAKNKYEHDRMEYYASIIQKLQNNVGLSALKFYSSRYLQYLNNNNNNNDNREEITQGELLQDDKVNNEYFEADCNNRDRFTS